MYIKEGLDRFPQIWQHVLPLGNIHDSCCKCKLYYPLKKTKMFKMNRMQKPLHYI